MTDAPVLLTLSSLIPRYQRLVSTDFIPYNQSLHGLWLEVEYDDVQVMFFSYNLPSK